MKFMWKKSVHCNKAFLRAAALGLCLAVLACGAALGARRTLASPGAVENEPTQFPTREPVRLRLNAEQIQWTLVQDHPCYDSAYTDRPSAAPAYMNYAEAAVHACAAGGSGYYNGGATPRHVAAQGGSLRFLGYASAPQVDMAYTAAYEAGFSSASFALIPQEMYFHAFGESAFLFDGGFEGAHYTGYALILRCGSLEGRHNEGEASLLLAWCDRALIPQSGYVPAESRVLVKTLRTGIGNTSGRIDVTILRSTESGAFQLLLDGEKAVQVENPKSAGGGFGFFTAYEAHNCAILTAVTYENLQITAQAGRAAAQCSVKFLDETTQAEIAPAERGDGYVGDRFRVAPPPAIGDYRYAQASRGALEGLVYQADPACNEVLLYYRQATELTATASVEGGPESAGSPDAPVHVNPGQEVAYQLTLETAAPEAGDFTVLDILPEGMRFTEGGVRVNGTPVTEGDEDAALGAWAFRFDPATRTARWDFAQRPAGKVVFLLRATAQAQGSGNYVNTASISGGGVRLANPVYHTRRFTVTEQYRDYKNPGAALREDGNSYLAAGAPYGFPRGRRGEIVSGGKTYRPYAYALDGGSVTVGQPGPVQWSALNSSQAVQLYYAADVQVTYYYKSTKGQQVAPDAVAQAPYGQPYTPEAGEIMNPIGKYCYAGYAIGKAGAGGFPEGGIQAGTPPMFTETQMTADQEVTLYFAQVMPESPTARPLAAPLLRGPAPYDYTPEKNAYINGAATAENGTEPSPVRVEIGDELTYVMDTYSPGPPSERYDILFVVDWSGSMYLSHMLDDGTTSVRATDYARDLMLDMSKHIFDNYPDSRVAVMGMNTPGAFSCTNNPLYTRIKYDTPFVKADLYEAVIRSAIPANPDQLAEGGDDLAQFLRAAIAKMKGQNVIFGGYTNPTFPDWSVEAKAPIPRDERDRRTPVILLISDFQITENSTPQFNNSGQAYWSTQMKDQADAFAGDPDLVGGVLMTLRYDHTGNESNSNPLFDFNSPAYDQLMTDYVITAGRVASLNWLFDPIAFGTPYGDALADFMRKFEDSIKRPIALVDRIPAGLEIVSTDPAAIIDGQKVTWLLRDYAEGPIQLRVTVRVREGGLYVNQARVLVPGEEFFGNKTYHYHIAPTKTAYLNGGAADPGTAADPVSVNLDDEVVYEISLKVPQANAPPTVSPPLIESPRIFAPTPNSFLTLAKSHDRAAGPVDIGDVITYTVRVENLGGGDASQTVFTDVIPAGTAFVPGSIRINGVSAGAAGSFDPATGTVRVELGNVKGTSTSSFDCLPYYDVRFQVRVDGTVVADDLKYWNQAKVTHKNRADESNPPQGYTNVSNATSIGLRMLLSADVTDVIPAGMTILSADSGASVSGQTVTWHLSGLEPGSDVKLKVTVKVTGLPPDSLYINQAVFAFPGMPEAPTNETFHKLEKLKLHIRQLVIGPLPGLHTPAMGYHTLRNGTSLLPLTSNSGTEGIYVTPYSDYSLPLGADLAFYAADIVPQYYAFDGHILTSDNGNHIAAARVPPSAVPNGEIELDYALSTEYWLTLYITPKNAPKDYSWDYATNEIGVMGP